MPTPDTITRGAGQVRRSTAQPVLPVTKAEELNKRIKGMIAKMEEIGARPDYTRGGNYNDRLEYSRLKSLIAERCIEAFNEGFCFEKVETECGGHRKGGSRDAGVEQCGGGGPTAPATPPKTA